jgi:hypothetical protein
VFDLDQRMGQAVPEERRAQLRADLDAMTAALGA